MKQKYCKVIITIIYTVCSVYSIFGQLIDTVYHTTNSGITYNMVNTVTTDDEQNVWIGTEYGLNRLNESGWQNWFAETSNLPNDAVRSLEVDQNNNVWIGGFQENRVTKNDFSFFQNDSIRPFTKPEELSSFIRDILFVEEDSIKRMLLATESALGIYAFQNQYWQLYNTLTSPYLSSQHFTSVAYLPNDGIYAGTLNGGLVNIKNNGNMRVLNGEETIPDNTILDIAIDTTGHLWLATPEGGLISYDSNSFESINPDTYPGFPTRSISSIAISSQNDIWCGTSDAGIVLLNKAGLRIFNMENSALLSNRINDVHIQNDTVIWAATDNGLARICTANKIVSSAAFAQPIKVASMAYPNPSNGNLVLSNKHFIKKLTVYNTNGKIVYVTTNSFQNINLPHLRQGNYLLNIQTQNTVYVQKILIFK